MGLARRREGEKGSEITNIKKRFEKIQGGKIMKESVYKSYDELPLMLNAETLAKVLGVAPSSAYELMHEKDFPTLKVGNRLVIPKEDFIAWVRSHTGGAK